MSETEIEKVKVQRAFWTALEDLDWSNKGVLPPTLGEGTETNGRSPYLISIEQFVQRFGSTSDRETLIDGLIDYRKALYDFGIVRGFQWVDGSFAENIERLEARSPRDIDVVTFFPLPPGVSEKDYLASMEQLGKRSYLRKQFSVDAYYIPYERPTSYLDVRLISYWYSIWSHRRDGTWKGFIELRLSPADDSKLVQGQAPSLGPEND